VFLFGGGWIRNNIGHFIEHSKYFPFDQAVNFCEVMKKNRNRCEVVAFEGKEHGFFNYG
jgi:hypothetical protein